jgi:ATP-binding cassette subfamily B protein
VLQENVAGIRLVKAFVRQRHERARFELNNLAYTEESVKVMQFAAFMSPVLTLCVNGGIVIVIWAGGLQAAHGKLSSGQLVAFINYLLTTMTPLLMMTILSNVWASGIASAKRIDEVLNVVPEIQDAPDASALELSGAPRIEFEDVSFSYAASQAEPVLDGVSFVAEPGETVAILGATGAGKSTLVKLIPRFYDVTRGRVLLGGRDVRELSQDSLLSQIGVVPQESVLFSGTVRDNIRYGKPEASDGEVLRAARAAQADEFISKLDQGYDARVEQRGQNFSGGQRQRLAIARALLLEPKILILDDSTSAVDVETETKIQQALAAQHPEQTRIVVAQRISSVLGADKILVLDAGRIVARGRHAELMKSSRVYQEIYASQLGTGITPESVAESAAVNS